MNEYPDHASCPVPWDIQSLVTASLYSLINGLVIVGNADDYPVVHINRTAVEIVRHSEASVQDVVPQMYDLEGIERYLGTGTSLRQTMDSFREGKHRHEVLGVFPVGNIYVSVSCFPIVCENALRGQAVLLTDVTEDRAKEKQRDEFFSITSHELRMPLIAINGCATFIDDFYKGNYPDASVESFLKEIRTTSDRLVCMVNDFLNMSRLEEGRFTYEVQAFCLTQLCEELSHDMQAVAEQLEVNLTLLILEDTAAPAYADPGRVKQVLTNFIGNALKFTPKGGLVKVTLEHTGSTYTVWVTDSGKGIPKEKQHLLFGKFQQVKGADEAYILDPNRSSGLGLYISKLMAEGMGCRVWLEYSSPGEGSTFAMTIPIAQQ